MQTAIEEWLDAQRDLGAAERFARWHEDVPAATGGRYRDLVPLSAPGPGEQYAFHVDLDACTGCKACVAACHSLNGLDEGETWREVSLLVGGGAETVVQQHVTSACHHCLDPACLEGCPVEAYEKDARTGIVLHLDDQCIGCRYCTLTCPYEAPKYNARLGIVRKCDLCHGRLAVGEAPACAQGCPNEAIRVTVVARDETAIVSGGLPGSPDPSLTRPSTLYATARHWPPGTARADVGRPRPGEAHAPLAVMLVLTQLSVGGFLVGRVVEAVGGGVFAAVHGVHAVMSLVLGVVALGASTLHLGRPLQAWRALLGVRTSWLSREILAFTVFAALASLYASVGVSEPALVGTPAVRALGAAVVASGLAGVACSVLLYHRTRRELWRADRTAIRFGFSTLVLGIAVTLLSGLAAAVLFSEGGATAFLAGWGRPLFALLAGVSIAKLGIEALDCRSGALSAPGKETAELLTGVLQQTTVARFATGAFGGVLLPIFFFAVAERSAPTVVGVAIVLTFVFVLAGELLERSLFFRASVPPSVRGGVA